MPNTFSFTKVTTTLILDKTILDADVNDSAAIKFSKLLASAIDSDLIPDGNGTRDLGDGTHFFAACYLKNARITNILSSMTPNADNTYDLGTPSKSFKIIYVNEILGAAGDMLFVFGMLGD